jgi:hypothetical protein
MTLRPFITIAGKRCNQGRYNAVLWSNTTAMKPMITRTLLLFATVFTFGYTRAAEPLRMPADKHTTLQRDLDRALSKNLAFPLLEKGNMTGEVYVSFVIDKEGRIEVKECSSANEQLKAYVLRKLSRIDIGDNPEGSWKTTHMIFNFRPEKA